MAKIGIVYTMSTVDELTSVHFRDKSIISARKGTDSFTYTNALGRSFQCDFNDLMSEQNLQKKADFYHKLVRHLQKRKPGVVKSAFSPESDEYE